MDEQIKSFYSNSAGIFSSINDFVINFQLNIPKLDKKEGLIKVAKDEMCIVLSAPMFKQLCIAMNEKLKSFEKNNGEIVIKDIDKKIKKIGDANNKHSNK